MSDGQGSRPRSSPSLVGRRVRLRTIHDGDFPFLYDLMTSPQSGGRVRFAGATPSPNQVAGSLWDSVLAQFLIEGASSGEPKGVVAITSANFRDAFAYLSVLGSREAQGTGLLIEGAVLGLNYAFSTWPFRKLYMEATTVSLEGFRSGLGRLFVEEGRLREHVFWNQRYEDVVILALYRETWAREVPRFLRSITVAPAPPRHMIRYETSSDMSSQTGGDIPNGDGEGRQGGDTPEPAAGAQQGQVAGAMGGAQQGQVAGAVGGAQQGQVGAAGGAQEGRQEKRTWRARKTGEEAPVAEEWRRCPRGDIYEQ